MQVTVLRDRAEAIATRRQLAKQDVAATSHASHLCVPPPVSSSSSTHSIKKPGAHSLATATTSGNATNASRTVACACSNASLSAVSGDPCGHHSSVYAYMRLRVQLEKVSNVRLAVVFAVVLAAMVSADTM